MLGRRNKQKKNQTWLRRDLAWKLDMRTKCINHFRLILLLLFLTIWYLEPRKSPYKNFHFIISMKKLWRSHQARHRLVYISTPRTIKKRQIQRKTRSDGKGGGKKHAKTKSLDFLWYYTISIYYLFGSLGEKLRMFK